MGRESRRAWARLSSHTLGKYYRITDAGRDALARLRPKIRELVDEVLVEEKDSPARSVPPATEKLE